MTFRCGRAIARPMPTPSAVPMVPTRRLPSCLDRVCPLDFLTAEGSHDDLVRNQRREQLKAVESDHRVKSPLNRSATGSLSAWVWRTASLMQVSRLWPLSTSRY